MSILYEKCFEKASFLVERGVIKLTPEMDIFQFADLLYKLEEEKQLKEELNDKNIDYNDEIVSIEDVGILDTIDISVSGDNLFYCNNILTKNSFGLPATADFMIALVTTEELQNLNQIMIKQLKNRYADPSIHRRFVVGVDRTKMRLYDVDEQAQNELMNDTDDRPIMDKSTYGERYHEEETMKWATKKMGRKDFSGLKV